MSYEIEKVVPVVEQLKLRVNGEVIATASAHVSSRWLLYFRDGERHLTLEVASREHAHSVLEWFGEKLSPAPAVINGEDELHLAKPGVVYQSDYNGGNQYRLSLSGKWEYQTPNNRASGYGWGASHSGKPYPAAYPLVAVES